MKRFKHLLLGAEAAALRVDLRSKGALLLQVFFKVELGHFDVQLLFLQSSQFIYVFLLLALLLLLR